MNRRALIFAGAGASTAVSREHFPTTRDFFEKLPESIKSHRLFGFVQSFLRQSDADRVIDIEEILWELETLRRFTRAAQIGEGIVGHALRSAQLAKLVLDHTAHFSHLDQTLATTQALCDGLIDEINAAVYDLYDHEPSDEELKNNWSYFFTKLRTANCDADIFTTNYDIAIETAAALDPKIQYDDFLGLKGLVKKQLNLDRWSNSATDKVLLTKLHGSINWQWGNNCINVSATAFTGNHKNHAIIYPGFKGESESDFFSPLHRYLGERLETAELLVFIGFAFRDEYINRLVAERAERRAKVVIINPDKSVKYPVARRRPNYIHAGFDRKSIDQVLSELSRIEPKVKLI
jgi:PAS domain-containing protein